MEEKKTKEYKVTIEIDEIRHLLLDNVDDAQNVRDENYLPRCINYECWHNPLIGYYKKYKNRSLLKADKLAFVVLLSYPKKYIETLNKISDIKLYNKHNSYDPDSDFIHRGIVEEPGSNCICSKHNIKIVHIVENKYTGIWLQVGSDCIERSKLLTNKELQKSKDTEKEYKRKQNELKRLEKKRKEQEEKRKEQEQKQKEQQEKELEQKIKDYRHCLDCKELNIKKIEPLWRKRCGSCYYKYKNNDD